jgi:hypothetical protein
MELESFTYDGVDYSIEETVKLGENRYQIRTAENKLFIFQYNEALFRWIITEIENE